MLALLAWLSSTAWANEIDAWVELYDGILIEAADNDVDAAVRTYEGLSRTLAADEPLRGISLYWLGRALDSDDDARGARSALRECVRSGHARARCLDLLGRIELEGRAIRRVPTRWDMSDGEHGFIHPWLYAEKGSIRMGDGDTEHPTVLVWSTTVSPDLDDQLLMGFVNPEPAPRGLRLMMRPTRQDTAIRMVVFDVHRNRFLMPGDVGVRVLQRAEWTTLRLDLSELVPVDGVRALNPAEIDHVVLQDVSAFQGAPSGANDLWIADVRVY